MYQNPKKTFKPARCSFNWYSKLVAHFRTYFYSEDGCFKVKDLNIEDKNATNWYSKRCRFLISLQLSGHIGVIQAFTGENSVSQGTFNVDNEKRLIKGVKI